jgi:chromate transporter
VEIAGPFTHLASLAVRFLVLSVFAVGGGVMGILPQIHTEFVTHDRLLDEHTFAQLLAVAQATPGPNFLIVTLIGWRVASWPGEIVVFFSFLAIPTAVTLTVGRFLQEHKAPVLVLIRRSLIPMTAALWIATGIVVAIATNTSLYAYGITIAVAAAALRFDVNPLYLCLGAAIVGWFLFP